jgi:hypothetical protein
LGFTGKGFLASGDDDSADVLAFIVFGKRVVDFFEEWAGEGVEGFRAVEGDYKKWQLGLGLGFLVL